MTPDELVHVVKTGPICTLEKSRLNTGIQMAETAFRPLSNLTFTRDQQITTAKGVVMCNLNTPTRSAEVAITKFCLQKLGVAVIGELSDPCKLEGGDFYPAGVNVGDAM